MGDWRAVDVFALLWWRLLNVSRQPAMYIYHVSEHSDYDVCKVSAHLAFDPLAEWQYLQIAHHPERQRIFLHEHTATAMVICATRRLQATKLSMGSAWFASAFTSINVCTKALHHLLDFETFWRRRLCLRGCMVWVSSGHERFQSPLDIDVYWCGEKNVETLAELRLD